MKNFDVAESVLLTDIKVELAHLEELAALPPEGREAALPVEGLVIQGLEAGAALFVDESGKTKSQAIEKGILDVRELYAKLGGVFAHDGFGWVEPEAAAAA